MPCARHCWHLAASHCMLLEVEVRYQGCRHKAVAAMKLAGRASCRQEDMAGAPGLASGNAYCGHRGRQTPQGCMSCPMAGFAGRYDPACSSKSVSPVTALNACMQSTLQQQNTTTKHYNNKTLQQPPASLMNSCFLSVLHMKSRMSDSPPGWWCSLNHSILRARETGVDLGLVIRLANDWIQLDDHIPVHRGRLQHLDRGCCT